MQTVAEGRSQLIQLQGKALGQKALKELVVQDQLVNLDVSGGCEVGSLARAVDRKVLYEELMQPLILEGEHPHHVWTPDDYVESTGYELPFAIGMGVRTEGEKVQDLHEDAVPLVGDFIGGFEGEVCSRVVEGLQLLVCIDIPHVDVPVGPGAHGHRVQLVSDGLHHLELHVKDLFFCIASICCQCKVINPWDVHLFNLASEE